MSAFPGLEIVDKLRQLITVHDRVMSWTSLLSAFTNPKLRHERAPGIPATPGAGTVSTPRGVYDESSRQHRATSQQHLLPSTFWPSSASSGSSWMQDREREVVSLKILDAKEDLQRENLALASQPAAISRLGPAVAG